MDSSTHNFYIVPALLRLFPDSKFLIPIRDPISWLDSYIDYGINNRLQAGNNALSPQKTRMGLFRYGDLYHKYTEGEKILKDFEMPSVEAHLFFYRNHYQTMLSIVPDARRIVYNTFELEENISTICRFLDITPAYLNLTNLQMNKGSTKHHVVAALDKLYLKEKVDFYCGDLHT